MLWQDISGDLEKKRTVELTWVLASTIVLNLDKAEDFFIYKRLVR